MIPKVVNVARIKLERPQIIEAPYNISEVLSRFRETNIKETPISTNDLRREINLLKTEISQIKRDNNILSHRISKLETLKIEEITQDIPKIEDSKPPTSESENTFLTTLQRVTSQKWFVKITLVVNKEYILKNEIALVDSGADLNCIQEGIII